MGQNFPQKIWPTKIFKNEYQICNKHIAMYACTKFQLIWATSDFGIKIAKKNIDEKSF